MYSTHCPKLSNTFSKISWFEFIRLGIYRVVVLMWCIAGELLICQSSTNKSNVWGECSRSQAVATHRNSHVKIAKQAVINLFGPCLPVLFPHFRPADRGWKEWGCGEGQRVGRNDSSIGLWKRRTALHAPLTHISVSVSSSGLFFWWSWIISYPIQISTFSKSCMNEEQAQGLTR